MEILEDKKIKKMIWKDDITLYYKEGVNDPDFIIIRFTAESGRYYSNFSSEDFEIE
ncbi:hypothetical protein AGMMS49546_08630 [Spirochaetia bacterium]|nr:hypothetical protein AGMMS49546_08630 [Spirochaetia bacterium]